MDGTLEYANNLSEAFDIDIRPILEKAADQQLSARKFEDATLLYRLSKVNLCSLQSTIILVFSLFSTNEFSKRLPTGLIYLFSDKSIKTCFKISLFWKYR